MKSSCVPITPDFNIQVVSTEVCDKNKNESPDTLQLNTFTLRIKKKHHVSEDPFCTSHKNIRPRNFHSICHVDVRTSCHVISTNHIQHCTMRASRQCHNWLDTERGVTSARQTSLSRFFSLSTMQPLHPSQSCRTRMGPRGTPDHLFRALSTFRKLLPASTVLSKVQPTRVVLDRL